jgi:hypothetical protein
MNLQGALFLVISFFMGLGLQARSLSDFDLEAYKTSKVLCAPLVSHGALSQSFSYFHLYVLTSSLKETDNHLTQLAASAVDPQKRQLITDYRTAGALGDLLHSEGFMQAMRECFPNESDHHRFVLTLIVAEKVGNFVVMAGAAVGASLSVRYLAHRFPQVFTAKSLSYLLKTSLLLSPLALSASVDQVTREKTQQESLDQQISNLEKELQNNNLSQAQRKQITVELRSLVLRKALEGLK